MFYFSKRRIDEKWWKTKGSKKMITDPTILVGGSGSSVHRSLCPPQNENVKLPRHEEEIQ
jgi:hypothetical protein